MCIWGILLVVLLFYVVHKVVYFEWIDPHLNKLKNGPTDPFVKKK